MKNDLITIVVPIFNVEKYLRRCLNSIIEQTYKNLEIILVDDGSTDDSPIICDEYKKKDNRITVIHKKNGGLSEARNTGINIAKGKYIGFVDSDDWIEIDMYEKMYKKMIEENADIAICGRVVEYSNRTSKKWYNENYMIMNNIDAIVALDSFKSFDMAAWDKLYKTELFSNIKYPVGKKCEDCYVTYRLFDKCDKIIYIPECFYHYFQREGSITKSKKVNMDYVYGSVEQLKYIEKNHPEIIDTAKMNVAFSNNALFHYMIENNINDEKTRKQLHRNANKYRKEVFKNKNINMKKKIKFAIFIFTPNIYKFLIKIKKRGKV